jgi:hypothetical protein
MTGTFIYYASYISLTTPRNLTQLTEPYQSVEAEKTCSHAECFSAKF